MAIVHIRGDSRDVSVLFSRSLYSTDFWHACSSSQVSSLCLGL